MNENNSVNEVDISEPELSKEATTENGTEGKSTSKKKISKRKMVIIGAIVTVVIIAIAIAMKPSKFERVKSECVQIAGEVLSGEGYFTIETIPDSWDRMDPLVREIMLASHQQDALDAIKYANDELGFPGVYSQMLNTTALMGRQSDENKKYKVAWTYHPDDGLTVTYSVK